MTYEELVREYIKLFILVLETVGQDIGNKVYQNVSNLLKENESEIKRMIDEELPFFIIVALLEVLIITKLHESDDLVEEENLLQGLTNDMWNRYLKTASNKFFRKHGLPVINDIDEKGYVKLLKIYKK